MKGDGGKGSGRRPSQVSEAELARRWEETFGAEPAPITSEGYRSAAYTVERLHALNEVWHGRVEGITNHAAPDGTSHP